MTPLPKARGGQVLGPCPLWQSSSQWHGERAQSWSSPPLPSATMILQSQTRSGPWLPTPDVVPLYKKNVHKVSQCGRAIVFWIHTLVYFTIAFLCIMQYTENLCSCRQQCLALSSQDRDYNTNQGKIKSIVFKICLASFWLLGLLQFMQHVMSWHTICWTSLGSFFLESLSKWTSYIMCLLPSRKETKSLLCN